MFLVVAVALISLPACASAPLAPTLTPIPLLATATAPPRATRPGTTATESAATPSPGVAAATQTSVEPSGHSQLDEELVRRTAEGFINRLVAGQVDSALRLFLSDAAQLRQAVQLTTQFSQAGSRLEAATLLQLGPAGSNNYRAVSLLRWAENEPAAGFATQTMILSLTYQRGLWLIDSATFGDKQTEIPTATPTRAPSSGRKTARLSGRLAFQASSGGDIYLINADGSGLRRLTDGLDPAWSPDGQTIAFTRWRTPDGVYLINPDGTNERHAVDGPLLKEVTWAPDGSRLVTTINISSAEPIRFCIGDRCFELPPFSFGQMWLVDLAVMTGSSPAENSYLSLPLDDRAVHTPTWSRTQDRIVYAGSKGLAWIDPGTLDKGRFQGSVWDTSPAYSPDGQRIAFMGRVHNRWEIFVMNADGTGRQQLTSTDPDLQNPPSNVAPSWSPDGKYLAFLSNRDGPWRIYVMTADGSGQRPMFGDKLDRLGIRYEWASERVISWAR